MPKRKRKIPTYIDWDFNTTYIQDPRTGKMIGRKRVRGGGDRTAVRRVKKKYKGHEPGEILGRVRSISVKEYQRRSKKGNSHTVRKHRRKK